MYIHPVKMDIHPKGTNKEKQMIATAMTRKEAKARLIQIDIDAANGMPTTGYVCKECEMPSPVGIGYASRAPQMTDVDSCPCGYSVKA